MNVTDSINPRVTTAVEPSALERVIGCRRITKGVPALCGIVTTFWVRVRFFPSFLFALRFTWASAAFQSCGKNRERLLLDVTHSVLAASHRGFT